MALSPPPLLQMSIFNGDPKAANSIAQRLRNLNYSEMKTVATDAFLVAENHSNKENRHSSIESQAAISLAAQQKTQPVIPQ